MRRRRSEVDDSGDNGMHPERFMPEARVRKAGDDQNADGAAAAAPCWYNTAAYNNTVSINAKRRIAAAAAATRR